MSIKHIHINQGTSAQLFKLPKDMIDYLWECIDVAKKKKICYKNNLAGHISHSYKLEDPQNLVIEKLLWIIYDNQKMVNFINEEFDLVYRKTFRDQNNHILMKPRLDDLWVNFQKKGDFQPIHDHSGLFSFVIWMDIPYHWEDEAKLPFARSNKGKNNNPSGGNFAFIHSGGISRSTSSYVIKMSPEMNGYCCFFPSDLCHQVYPFFTSDKDRISISGNIVWDKDHKEVKQTPFIVSNT